MRQERKNVNPRRGILDSRCLILDKTLKRGGVKTRKGESAKENLYWLFFVPSNFRAFVVRFAFELAESTSFEERYA